MKIKVIGEQIQNNKRTRYALIGMKMKREDISVPYEDKVVFLYDNDLSFLQEVKLHATERNIDNKKFYLDLKIFDYENMCYVK